MKCGDSHKNKLNKSIPQNRNKNLSHLNRNQVKVCLNIKMANIMLGHQKIRQLKTKPLRLIMIIDTKKWDLVMKQNYLNIQKNI